MSTNNREHLMCDAQSLCEFCLCKEAAISMSFVSRHIKNNTAIVCNDCFESARAHYAKMGTPGQIILMPIQAKRSTDENMHM